MGGGTVGGTGVQGRKIQDPPTPVRVHGARLRDGHQGALLRGVRSDDIRDVIQYILWQKFNWPSSLFVFRSFGGTFTSGVHTLSLRAQMTPVHDS